MIRNIIATGACAIVMLTASTAAQAQTKYYSRAIVAPTAAPTAPPGPVAKANCGTPVPNTVLSVYGSGVGSATTPFLNDNAWIPKAIALCRSFAYGTAGKCDAYRFNGAATVGVYGYPDAKIANVVSSAGYGLSDSFTVSCTPM